MTNTHDTVESYIRQHDAALTELRNLTHASYPQGFFTAVQRIRKEMRARKESVMRALHNLMENTMNSGNGTQEERDAEASATARRVMIRVEAWDECSDNRFYAIANVLAGRDAPDIRESLIDGAERETFENDDIEGYARVHEAACADIAGFFNLVAGKAVPKSPETLQNDFAKIRSAMRERRDEAKVDLCDYGAEYSPEKARAERYVLYTTADWEVNPDAILQQAKTRVEQGGSTPR